MNYRDNSWNVPHQNFFKNTISIEPTTANPDSNSILDLDNYQRIIFDEIVKSLEIIDGEQDINRYWRRKTFPS